MIVRSGISTSTYHVSKDTWQTTSAWTCGRPHQQGRVVDHVRKDVWQTASTRTRGIPRQQVHME
jgi:hypothetical protein